MTAPTLADLRAQLWEYHTGLQYARLAGYQDVYRVAALGVAWHRARSV